LHSSPGEALGELAGNPQVLARERLCRALADKLEPKQKDRFWPMVNWELLVTPDAEKHPYLRDVRLSDSINMVERGFYECYFRLEQEVREHKGIQASEPTSPELMMHLAAGTQAEVFLALQNMASRAVGGPENLIVRLLANLAANRFILESAHFEVLADKACVANIKLVTALNSRGVHEVPVVVSDRDVEDKLMGWFGRDGLLAQEPGIERPLQGKDLKHLLELSDQVQQEFIVTRGSIARDMAQEAYDGPQNKLLFALGLVACFYGQVEVAKELLADHNNKRRAFPGRTVRGRPLGKHSMELFKSLFGSLAFSNRGWELRPDGMSAYARALAYKRGKLQELVFLVFKRMHSEQLLAIHNELMGGLSRAKQ
jgi:hypothetical protein